MKNFHRILLVPSFDGRRLSGFPSFSGLCFPFRFLLLSACLVFVLPAFPGENEEWLLKHRIITYSQIDWRPLAIIDEHGRTMEGILQDYLSVVSEKTGIKFKFVPSSSFDDLLSKFERAEINMLLGTEDILDRVPDGRMTKSFLKYPTVIVTGYDISYVNRLSEMEGKRFVFPKESQVYDKIKETLPEGEIIETSTILDAMQLITGGKADVFIGHLAPAILNLSRFSFQSKLKISGQTDFEFRHHLIFQKGDELFVEIIDRALEEITVEDEEEILGRWLNLKVVSDHFDSSLLWQIPLGSFLVLAVVLFWGLFLRKLLKKNEEQHLQIRDSIEYSLLIQKAIISDSSEFDNFFKSHFVIWKPRDVVGGDIYSFNTFKKEESDKCFIIENENGHCVLTLADCAGHGVPGAMLAMLFKSIEEHSTSAILDPQRFSTADMLKMFEAKTRKLRRNVNDENNPIYFDCGVMFLDYGERLLRYSGANLPLLVYDNKRVSWLEANRVTVGLKKAGMDVEYAESELKLEPGYRLFLTTDGYYDQIGGERGHPLGKRRFVKLVEDSLHLSLDEQATYLEEGLEKFKGNYPTVDDVCLIGLEF